MKMNHFKTRLFSLGVILCALALSVNVHALTIDDSTLGANTYYGGTIVGSYNDVIGLGNFDVDGMVVNQTANGTTAVLSGLYFGTPYAKGGLAIGGSRYGNPGDLYISSGGWIVNKPADHARYDTFDANEGWDYVVSFVNQKVYALNYSGITRTGNEGYWAGYRTDQAWRGGYDTEVAGSWASVVPDTVNMTLTFNFANLGNVEYMGFHWTQACGNDVVEGGGTPVPEPGTLLLLGLGLVGVAAVRRKFKS